MSKVRVIYDLENIDDELALNRALKSTNMALVLFEIQYNLQKKCISEFEQQHEEDPISFVFKKIYDLMDQHDINLNDLIR